MRVTANAYSNSIAQQLNALASRQNRLQAQATSNQRINALEDDPAAVQRVLGMQSDAAATAQFKENAAIQIEVATATFNGIKSLKTISNRAGEIATLADGLKSPQELQAYATEVRQLLSQALGVANSQFNGSYLFAGSRSDQPPFVATRDATQKVVGISYQGNETVPEAEIAPGDTVSARVPGSNASGSGVRGLFNDSASGADFFGHLIALAEHLESGDVSTIATTDRTLLQKDEDNILFHVTYNGAVQARLSAATSQLTDRSTALSGQISREVDADLAQTLVEFNSAQVAYQAALQTSAKLLDLGLMSYLR